MKLIFLKPLKDWFGYTRRERRATFILLILIAAVAGIRFIVPNRRMNIEIMPLESHETVSDSIPVKKTGAISRNYQQTDNAKRRKAIDLNKCDSASLEALPGLGPVLSSRIIKYRNLLGGFAQVSQLNEVYGLSEEIYNIVSGMLKADPADIRKIDINTADYRQLIRLPYFERYEVTSILKYRELSGKIKSCDDLVGNGIITSEKAEKVKWYLEFGENNLK